MSRGPAANAGNARHVAGLFVGAMLCFSGSLLTFLREIQLASATLRFGIRRAEHARALAGSPCEQAAGSVTGVHGGKPLPN